MPFCPVCRMEYQPGVERCPDCDEPLVEQLPPQPEPQWDATDWETVEEVTDRATAAIIEGFLLEEGFPVRILDRSDTEFALSVGELAQIEVQVPVADLERALAILAERDEAFAVERQASEEPEAPEGEGTDS
ncbi:MAG: DUF2007 domain-containing protein [Acidobacteria bacterium]|nr:DUF2007 domain-containing protein [Acidobacteriota bacterium]